MSILIKGMEMPTEQRLEVLIFKNGYVAYYDVYGRYLGQARAIQLPEKHGPLKDSDEIISAIKGKFCYGCLCPSTSYNCQLCKITKIVEMVSDASTIIEAGGGNGNG